MDGSVDLSKAAPGSLQRRLATWLTLAIVLAAALAGSWAYLHARAEANELQDSILAQVLALVHPNSPVDRIEPGSDTPWRLRDPESQLLVQPLTREPQPPPALPLPASLPDGLHTVQLAAGSYRVMVRTLPDGTRVAVAQASEVRDEFARHTALHTLLPLAALIPALTVVAVMLVRHALAPVRALAQEVATRRSSDLHALARLDLPQEIEPFVAAINTLLAKVDASMLAQRRFVADAAHELRTPLTALSLQAERLAEAEMSGAAQDRLEALHQGLRRARHLLDQLLQLARAQAPANGAGPGLALPATPVLPVVCQVLAELLPLAEARHIDLGLGDAADVAARVTELDLASVLRNLADNAIRYSPAGGRVDLMVRVEGDQVHLLVRDDGPGIPENERRRVFDPFYRVLGTEASGSGLGLSIVQAIATRAGGHVGIDNPRDGLPGLSVRVTFRLARTGSP